MIDVVGAFRVDVAEWVIGERGQVDDCVEADEVGALSLAQVQLHCGDFPRAISEGTALKKTIVQPDDRVARGFEDGNHHRADISLISSYQNAHLHSPKVGLKTTTGRRLDK